MFRIRFLTAILAVLIVAACGEADGPGEATAIRINAFHDFASSPILVMRHRKILENRLPDGVAIHWTSVAAASDVRDALVAGQIDIASTGAPAFITAIENGLPLAFLGPGPGTWTRLYSKNPAVKHFNQVGPGDRIAIISKAGTVYLNFITACQEAFGQALIFDRNLVIVPPAEALALLASSDELALGVFHFPNTIKADQVAGLTAVDGFAEVLAEYNIGNYLMASQKFLAANPGLTEAFMAAWAEAVEYINVHPDEAAALIAAEYGLEPEHLSQAFRSLPLQIEWSDYDRTAGFLYQAGILASQPKKFADVPQYTPPAATRP